MRRFARELGVPLAQVTGSGPKSRILKEDIQSFVKQSLAGGVSARGGGLADLGLPPWPKVDFAKFGADRDSRPARASRRSRRRGWRATG